MRIDYANAFGKKRLKELLKLLGKHDLFASEIKYYAVSQPPALR